jgi:2-dehydro-3-deoxyphosphooctonate aldolase (KDO 8-P synthase)
VKTPSQQTAPVRTVTAHGPRASVSWGPKSPLSLIAGPCVIESRAHCLGIARALAALSGRLGVALVFKASFDKANRSSLDAYRGPGIDEGLDILAEVREATGLPILTDIHEPWQADRAAKSGVDVIQIPAFLCRQTDLLLAAGETGRVVNVKKMQGMAPEAMAQVVRKIESTGNRRIVLTERGESFGYGNLVADMRNLMVMRGLGCPVVFDATHSVQRPGALGAGSGGDSKWAPALARAAVATGACDGVFLETHEMPAKALSDASNCIALSAVGPLWRQLAAIDAIAGRVATASRARSSRRGS